MVEKIVLGMSGGMDSAYAAYLLKRQGYDVICAYILMDDKCDSSAEARALSDAMGLKFVLRDARSLFRSKVLLPFVDSYTSGKTPNPCVLCNPCVKLHSLIMVADELGINKIATGHYASPCRVGGRYSFAPAADKVKDQGYFLYALPQEYIARVIMPLSGVNKREIKEFFSDGRIYSFTKGESNDICFASQGYRPILEQYGILPSEGRFVDVNGKTLGIHKGIHNYTVGQRKGLGIALGKPAFVKSINANDNTVVLSFAEHAYCDGFEVGDINYLAANEIVSGDRYLVRVRYRAAPVWCRVYPASVNGALVVFDEPQRIVAPGQSAVFYNDNGIIAFGGIIR